MVLARKGSQRRFFCGGTAECTDVMFFQLLYVFHSVHHFADAGFAEVVQQLLCRKMCSHVRCSIVLKIPTRSKGNRFKTCAPGEQETSQTCQQRALRSQATERGGTIAHTEPSFRGKVAPQFSPMQHKSEVFSGIFKFHRVERMRHTNQVGVKSTWSWPEEHQICTLECSQSRSAPSLRIKLLVATQCVHIRWRVQLVENKNETTLEPTTVHRSQIQEFRKKMQVACNQDYRLQCVCLELPLGAGGPRQEVGRAPLFSGVLGLTWTSELVFGWSVRGLRHWLIFLWWADGDGDDFLRVASAPTCFSHRIWRLRREWSLSLLLFF